jgi:PEP-CTERM motif
MRLVFTLVIAVLVECVALPASIAETLDQHNDVSPSATADTATPFSQEIAQTFTVGLAGTLTKIDAQLVRILGSGGSAIFTLYDTTGGVPNTVLGTRSLNWDAIPSTGFGYQSFEVSSLAIPVTVGQVLAFGIKSSGEAGYGLRSSFDQNTYAAGESKSRTLSVPPGPWVSYSPSHDYGFKTYVLTGVPGDYNQDGHVDAADYTVWRDNLGATEALPNDDTNGVDLGDYERWKLHYGEPAGSGSTVSVAVPVPEPASLGLLTVAGIAAVATRRR